MVCPSHVVKQLISQNRVQQHGTKFICSCFNNYYSIGVLINREQMCNVYGLTLILL